jgi:predicted dehydrogenase
MAEIKTAGVIGAGNAGEKHVVAYEAAGLDVKVWAPGDDANDPILDTLDEVLACDVVSICSPDDTHVDYLARALYQVSTGQAPMPHVLCEKPLTHNAADFDEVEKLAQYAARHNRVFECHLPLRYHPPFVKALGEVRAGVLGKIVSIDMAYHYGRPEKLKGWRGQIPNYSLIVGGGIHLVDLACGVAGGVLHAEAAVLSRSGSQDARVTFALNDVMCTLATTCHEHVPHMHEMRIIGTAGVREIQNTAEVDHSIGVRLFLDKVRNGQRGNIAEAIAANRICLDIAEALA